MNLLIMKSFKLFFYYFYWRVIDKLKHGLIKKERKRKKTRKKKQIYIYIVSAKKDIMFNTILYTINF